METAQKKETIRSEWTAHLEAWSSSGQSIAAYCREHNLSPKRFYNWRSRLKAKSKALDGKAESARSEEMFVAVDLPKRRENSSGVFTLYRGQDVLHVPMPFDSASLIALLQVLERQSC